MDNSKIAENQYRGRFAPSPTGYLHLGHARTFWTAQERARQHNGVMILRNEDLDIARCHPKYVTAMIEDMHWFGLTWTEGPDSGGAYGPYAQSARRPFYETAFARLRDTRAIYPCRCSRQDVLQASQAPHQTDDEPIYPGTCRPPVFPPGVITVKHPQGRCSWRFRVPDGEWIRFQDGRLGEQAFLAGRDFGDFVIWRHDGIPSYQLAVVVDDNAMKITEVVRGADLLLSTARQILLYQAMGWRIPSLYHCPLMTDERGIRLAKRHHALSLRKLRESSAMPESLRASWGNFSGANRSAGSD